MRFAAFLLLGLATGAGAHGFSGRASAQWRGFSERAAEPSQAGAGVSLALQPEWRRDDGDAQQAVVLFGRWDQRDGRRSHWDVREFYLLRGGEGYEWRLGVRKLFWGTVESRHLVDVVNQTDLVEDLDEEEKLGQPMANLAVMRDWGTLELFALPVFRERTFPGPDGRPRTRPWTDGDAASYESGRGRSQASFAARWSRSAGAWDVGLSHFSGTGREPTLLPGADSAGRPVLTPRYELIEQTGLDLQATAGRWLWKLEAMRRAGQGPAFGAVVGGFEYTFSRALGSDVDLGLLGEYLYDERGRAGSPFQDDAMAGLRLALNDAPSSQLLAVAVVDRLTQARFVRVEASRRLGSRWTVSLDGRFFAGARADDPLASFGADDHVQAELALHF